MFKIRLNMLPVGHRNRPGLSMKPKGVLFHTTNNWSPTADDDMHAEYMEKTAVNASWHYTVDRDSVTQHLPLNENGWHAGDGYNGYYNRNFIGVEIACNSTKYGSPIDKDTYNNAVGLVAMLVEEFNFTIDQVLPHNVVKGKDCPHHTLFDRDKFRKDVFDMVEKKKVKYDYSGHWAEKEIERVKELGIMVGRPDGAFSPNANITRAEVAKVVCNLLDYLGK